MIEDLSIYTADTVRVSMILPEYAWYYPSIYNTYLMIKENSW